MEYKLVSVPSPSNESNSGSAFLGLRGDIVRKDRRLLCLVCLSVVGVLVATLSISVPRAAQERHHALISSQAPGSLAWTPTTYFNPLDLLPFLNSQEQTPGNVHRKRQFKQKRIRPKFGLSVYTPKDMRGFFSTWKMASPWQDCGFGGASEGRKTQPIWEHYADLHQEQRQRLKETHGRYPHRIIIWQCLAGMICGGWGDQVRGLTSSLYLAMLTSRALFVQWERLNVTISDVLLPAALNTTLPVTLNTSNCEHISLSELMFFSGPNGFSDYGAASRSWKALQLIRSSLKPCVLLTGNSAPTALWNEQHRGFGHKLTSLQAAVNRTYCMGCAMNYMFNLTRTYNDLLDGASFVSHRALDISAGFVGIQLRFGDGSMMAAHADSSHKDVVDRAVACARVLGKRLFNQSRNVSIFLASDSQQAKVYALSLKASVFVYTEPPVHSETWRAQPSQRGLKYFADSLVDHAMLSKAQGFVGCNWRDHCRLSSYSESAIQESFLPAEYAWSLTGNACGCRPAYRC